MRTLEGSEWNRYNDDDSMSADVRAESRDEDELKIRVLESFFFRRSANTVRETGGAIENDCTKINT